MRNDSGVMRKFLELVRGDGRIYTFKIADCVHCEFQFQ